MICSVIQNWEEQSPKENTLDFNKIHSDLNFHLLDKGIKRFSDLLTVAYHYFGKLTLENVAAEDSENEGVIEKELFDKVFLSRTIQEKQLPDKDVENDNQIESSNQRKTIDVTKKIKLETSLQGNHEIDEFWIEDGLPSLSKYITDLNKSGSLLDHLKDVIFDHSSEESDHEMSHYGNDSENSISGHPFASHINRKSDLLAIYIGDI
jgi:hypothetical protein